MTANSSLISIAERLSNSHILCVGDLILDSFVSGEVLRISPEAPIPVLRSLHERTLLGGAGNVVRNIRGLGGRVTLVGAVGKDSRGIQLAEMLGELKEVQ